MNGKWKMKYLATFDIEEGGFKKLPVADVFAMPEGDEKDELMEMANAVLEITDTSLKIMVPIDPNEIEEAKAAGAPVTDDGFVIAQQSVVKIEDGVYYFDSEMQGEINGEEIDSWQPLACNDDGELELNPMMTFERM